MATLVAILSTGKGTWSEVMKLMSQGDWEKIVLVTNSFGKERFSHQKEHSMIVVDFSSDQAPLVNKLTEEFKRMIPSGFGTEVALNISSGTGKEHMAVMSSLLKAGLGMRFVIPGDKGFEEV